MVWSLRHWYRSLRFLLSIYLFICHRVAYIYKIETKQGNVKYSIVVQRSLMSNTWCVSLCFYNWPICYKSRLLCPFNHLFWWTRFASIMSFIVSVSSIAYFCHILNRLPLNRLQVVSTRSAEVGDFGSETGPDTKLNS